MKMRFFKVLSVFLVISIIMTVMSVSSAAVVEIYEEKLIYGTEIAEKVDYNIVPGVTESYVVLQNDDGSNRVDSYVLEIDMSNPEIGIVTSYKDYMNGLGDAEWGMQALRDQAVEVEDYYRNTVGNEDFEVIAGVNGDFFNMGNGAPTGTLVMGGIYYNVNEDWPFFAILDDGSCVIGDRKAKIPDNAVELIGGPEVLIKNGEFTKAVNTSGYGVEAHPRTAIGIKADGSIVMLVSDGRMEPVSYGQTFHMLAEEMLALGCVDALCLDGGGSASFISQREGEDVLTLRNVPSDGIERTVSTGLLIYTNTDTNVKSDNNKWFDNNGKIGYYGEDGTPVKGEQTIDGFTYEFDDNGVLNSFAKVNVDGTLAVNTWSDTVYYLGEDGLPVKGEQTIDGVKFTFNSVTGKLEKSELAGKWFEIMQSVCYFDEDGNKVSGKKTIDGYKYKFDENGELTVYACVKDDGTLVRNQWVSTYYMGEDGLPVTGEFSVTEEVRLDIRATAPTKVLTLKYKFDEKGNLVKGALYKNGNYTFYYLSGIPQRGWHNIDGYWHYFDRQTGGGMATGANSDKVSIDFDRTDGLYTVSSTDAMLLFKFDNNGRLIRGAWLETDYGKAYYWGNHERLTGWQTVDKYTYYINNDSYTVTGEQTIDGVTYMFDSKGHKCEKSTVAETCTKDGYTKYTCKCGETIKTDVVSAKGHDFAETVAVAPTCTEEGYTKHVCACGEIKKSDVVPAVGHNFVKTDFVDPTCTAEGYIKYECADCGAEKGTDYVDATGHSMKVKEVVAPTCLIKGYTKYECSDCDFTSEADYVDATGHNMEVKKVVAPTCLVKGYTRYECSGCDLINNADYVDATGHNMEVREVIAPSCVVKGHTRYECSDCGLTNDADYVDATGHTAGEWEKISDTLERRYCTVCKEVVEENRIPLPGDANGDGVITAADARMVLRMAAEIDEIPEGLMPLIDMNKDNEITASDARTILRISAELE